MIYLTGDVHHATLNTADQRYLLEREGLTEVQITQRFVERLEAYGASATLFFTGRAFVEEWDNLRPYIDHPLIEVAGHTHRAFEPQLLHRVFKKVVGSYVGPRGYQRADIRRCLDAIEQRCGVRPVSWRNHAYHNDQNTASLLVEAGIRLVSDEVDSGATGAYELPEGLLSLPINVLPDHEHLYHGPRTAPRVAAWAKRYRWADDFGERSYVPDVWCDIVLEQLRERQRAGVDSVLMLHPLCQYIADGFRSLDRILEVCASLETGFCRDARARRPSAGVDAALSPERPSRTPSIAEPTPTVDGPTGDGRELSLFVFVDALGWALLENRPLAPELLPHQRPLRSELGYSSTCLPSIFTGRPPADHGHFSFFYYAPGASPFRSLKPMQHLPGVVFDRARVRGKLSKAFAKLRGWTGYFDIYAIPWEEVDHWDTCEKEDLFTEAGIGGLPTVFTKWARMGLRVHCSDWRASEEQNFASLEADLRAGRPQVAFLYTAALDGLMHHVGPEADETEQKLRDYERRLRELVELAGQRYDTVRLFVFSDHGMARVETTHDLEAALNRSGLTRGVDYTAFLDSTMARFYLLRAAAREPLVKLLREQAWGTLLDDDALSELGCLFPGRRFGDLIFVARQGALIVPSHMGRKPITGMHGYLPSEPASMASLSSSVEPPLPVHSIRELHQLMVMEATRHAPAGPL